MLSYQTIEMKGSIETMRVDPSRGNSVADIQINGLNGLLTVPIDDPDMHQIGDVIAVHIVIDRVIELSGNPFKNCEVCHG